MCVHPGTHMLTHIQKILVCANLQTLLYTHTQVHVSLQDPGMLPYAISVHRHVLKHEYMCKHTWTSVQFTDYMHVPQPLSSG